MTHRPGVAPEDANMDATKGFVVPADGEGISTWRRRAASWR